jgi:hypothetical protein
MNKELRIWKITYAYLKLGRVGHQLRAHDMERQNRVLMNTGARSLYQRAWRERVQ